MKWCKKCEIDVEGMFCPECKTIASPKIEDVEINLECEVGEIHECKIWAGEMLGIRIGITIRHRCFSEKIFSPILWIDGHKCYAKLPDKFWTTCPEIRVANDEIGNNYLNIWIRKNGLHPHEISTKLRGKPDIILLEVVVPGKEFKLNIKDGSGR